MKKIIILPLAFVAIAVIYPMLIILMIALFAVDQILMALDAVADFLDYHVTEQIELFKAVWNGD
jgi:hypothetical protein